MSANEVTRHCLVQGYVVDHETERSDTPRIDPHRKKTYYTPPIVKELGSLKQLMMGSSGAGFDSDTEVLP